MYVFNIKQMKTLQIRKLHKNLKKMKNRENKENKSVECGELRIATSYTQDSTNQSFTQKKKSTQPIKLSHFIDTTTRVQVYNIRNTISRRRQVHLLMPNQTRNAKVKYILVLPRSAKTRSIFFAHLSYISLYIKDILA